MNDNRDAVQSNPKLPQREPVISSVVNEADSVPEIVDIASELPGPNVVKNLEKKSDDVVVGEVPKGEAKFKLPKCNWLKMNARHLDGRTPFTSFLKNPDGTYPPKVDKDKKSFELMFELGYELISVTHMPRGDYLYFFFRLPDEAYDEIPASMVYAP